MNRLKGAVFSGCRCSHATAAEAEVLNKGTREEPGSQLADIHMLRPNIHLLGGR
jgi:hypothetical protein